MEHDMKDQDIRAMVSAYHKPEEVMRRQSTYGNESYIDSIICCRCKVTWPCRPVTNLRDWERKNNSNMD